VLEGNTTWKMKPPYPEAQELAKKAGISGILAQLLLQRGISSPNKAHEFLNPRLSELSDPGQIKDMDAAVDRVLWAAEKDKPICIYGDFDADGVTATALLFGFFTDLGLKVTSYIPHRLDEGYGLKKGALKQIHRSGAGLVITVDCGTTDIEEIEYALGLGLEVIVTDHHKVSGGFLPPCPVLNPHRAGCRFPFKGLAGVGVAFYLAAGVRAALRAQDWFLSGPEPDIRQYLDLVAIGTLADMVPLFGENRILVTAGIRTMKACSRPGLRALEEVAGITPSLLSYEDVTFRLAPLINAAGRMDTARLALDILTTSNGAVAHDLAGNLLFLNRTRQALEGDILEEIKVKLPQPSELDGRRTIVVHGPGWHQGVLGIVASRLVEQYNRPVLVLAVKDGLASGSGRSIRGFDLHKALCEFDSMFKTFGGHRHAVGLSLAEKDLERLSHGIETACREQIAESDLHPVIETDLEVPPSVVSMDTVNEIEGLSPFGTGNPEPLFLGRGLEVLESRVVGKRHLKIRVSCNGVTHDGIGFGLGEDCTVRTGDRIKAAYTPTINRWQGTERLQLKIAALDMDRH
jgi:single-stranded-DNA-specific exonuclease